MKRSPFYSFNLQAGATMSKGAWTTPSIYTTIMEEYNAVRHGVGLSDWSTMGKFDVQGAQSKDFIQKLIVNDINRLKPGQGLYSCMLNEDGGVCDDTTVYQLAENHYFLVGSTSGRFNDVKHFKKHSVGMQVSVVDVTAAFGILSVQGPKSRNLLNTICTPDLSDVPYFGCKHTEIANCTVLVARSGFTGELGYELFISAEDGADVWEAIWEAGLKFELKLCGIDVGVDYLRMEKGYLAGEIHAGVNPYEVGLGWSVRLNKEFIGCDVLKKVKETGGPKRLLLGYTMNDTDELGIPDADVLLDGKKIGIITSVLLSPHVGKSIGMVFLDAEYAVMDKVVSITTDKGLKSATLCSKSFYDPENLRTKS